MLSNTDQTFELHRIEASYVSSWHESLRRDRFSIVERHEWIVSLIKSVAGGVLEEVVVEGRVVDFDRPIEAIESENKPLVVHAKLFRDHGWLGNTVREIVEPTELCVDKFDRIVFKPIREELVLLVILQVVFSQ
jgi:hypothetical protein